MQNVDLEFEASFHSRKNYNLFITLVKESHSLKMGNCSSAGLREINS